MVMRSSLASILALIMFSCCHVPASAAPPDPRVSALFHAVYAGDDKKIDSLLRKNPALVNARQHRQTLLSVAVYRAPDTVPLLLHLGASVNARNNNGETALHQTVEDGNRPLAALLVRHGARDETNPIFDAISRDNVPGLKAAMNKLPPAMREADLASNSVLNSTMQVPGRKPEEIFLVFSTASDITPLDAAVFWRHADMVQALLAKGANVNGKNDTGKTPLHVAVGLCDKDMVSLLLAHGADVNAKTQFQGPRMDAESDDLTPLHIAAQSCGSDMIGLLIFHGAKVNATDSNGETPLFYAIDRGSPEIVAALLSQGADPNVRNKSELRMDGGGETPLHHAVIRLRYRHDVKSNASLVSIMTLLLSHGANVNAKDNRGLTPLALATGYNDVSAFLRQHGAQNYGHAQ